MPTQIILFFDKMIKLKYGDSGYPNIGAWDNNQEYCHSRDQVILMILTQVFFCWCFISRYVDKYPLFSP